MWVGGRCIGRSAARAMKVFVNPGVFGRRHPVDGVRNQHALLRQHGDAVGDCIKRVEVMGDHEHAQPQGVAQGQNQLIEGAGAYRIEPGSGFVQKQDVRIQRQRSCQRRA